MALAQVRVQLNGEWVNLTFSEAANAYVGYITPEMTSRNQPGGYFEVTAEAGLDNGEAATAKHKLTVTETTAPVITLTGPEQGYLTTNLPEITVAITDEPNGSGVNPESISARLDGVLVDTGEISLTAIIGGYAAKYAPTSPLTEGAHTIAFSAEDYDGNAAALALQYTVDTVPPELYIKTPRMRHIVDTESVTVSGEVWDATAGAVTVTVNGKAVPVTGGRFSTSAPLDVGENTIVIMATDGAGLTTTAEIYMIRLVTNRAKSDIAYLQGLIDRGMKNWTRAEAEWFLSAISKGAYNHTDLNRVCAAVRHLKRETDRRGYNAQVDPIISEHLTRVFMADSSGRFIVDSDGYFIVSFERVTGEVWTEFDAPTRGQMETYRKNVAAVCGVQPGLVTVPLPETMRKSGLEDWNNLEKALVAADALFDYYTSFYSGETVSGEF